MIHFAQIDIGRVFEDEAAHVFLADEINIPVLLLSSCGAAKLGFQVAALDPPRYYVGINPQCCARPLAK